MAEVHGKDTVVKIDNVADALTDVSAFVKSVGHGRTGDTHDITTFGDTWKEFIAGLKDGGEFTFEGNWDPTPTTGSHDVFKATLGNSKTIELNPAGTAAGTPKITVEAIGTAYDFAPAHDDVIQFSCTLKVSGAVVDALNV